VSVRGDFCAELQRLLKNALDVDFELGVVDGPQQDRDIGCVWWEGKRPWSRDGNQEENFYRVRLLRRFRQDQGGEEPRQTTETLLMQAAEDLEEALRACLIEAGHEFFTVIEVTLERQQHLVEAQLTAYDQNRTSRGG
jgi:hypothetical protein